MSKLIQANILKLTKMFFVKKWEHPNKVQSYIIKNVLRKLFIFI